MSLERFPVELGLASNCSEPRSCSGNVRRGASEAVNRGSPDQESALTHFFCIGAAKSGTTLLARLLDQHPDIACIVESYSLIPQRSGSIFNSQSRLIQTHGFSAADTARWVEHWSPVVEALESTEAQSNQIFPAFVRTFRDTMTEALEDFRLRCNARVVGDKWPYYVTLKFLPTVLQAFPAAKLLYTVRDPRGIWNSGQKFKERKRGYNILADMIAADRLLDPYRENPNILVIRYEDLVCNSAVMMKRVYEFLGCEFSPDYLTYDRSRDPYPERWGWVPESTQPLTRWHTEKWKTQMAQKTIDEISDVFGGFIEKYGYERSAALSGKGAATSHPITFAS